MLIYIHKNSPLHQADPRFKLLMLLFTSTSILFFDNTWLLLSLAFFILMGYRLAQFSWRDVINQLRPVAWFLLFFFCSQYYLDSLTAACLSVCRFSILIIAASLLTLTTSTSEMMSAIESCLKYLHPWLPVSKISLAISLAIRFIPLLQANYHEVQAAQQARGMHRNLLATIIPTLIRTLKMADQIAEALTARAFK